jgi:hypothetical protein
MEAPECWAAVRRALQAEREWPVAVQPAQVGLVQPAVLESECLAEAMSWAAKAW